ncbi:MAG: hypothetical protein ACYDEY_13885 [Acidimicrobiales bacterium]
MKPTRGKDQIALRAAKVLNRHKMAKHFELTITDTAFSFTRKPKEIAAEAALDGIYVVRCAPRSRASASMPQG